MPLALSIIVPLTLAVVLGSSGVELPTPTIWPGGGRYGCRRC